MFPNQMLLSGGLVGPTSTPADTFTLALASCLTRAGYSLEQLEKATLAVVQNCGSLALQVELQQQKLQDHQRHQRQNQKLQLSQAITSTEHPTTQALAWLTEKSALDLYFSNFSQSPHATPGNSHPRELNLHPFTSADAAEITFVPPSSLSIPALYTSTATPVDFRSNAFTSASLGATSSSEVSVGFRVLLVVLYTGLLIGGLLGNGAVILCVLLFRCMRRSTANLFFLNLALSDLLVFLLCEPVVLVSTLNNLLAEYQTNTATNSGSYSFQTGSIKETVFTSSKVLLNETISNSSLAPELRLADPSQSVSQVSEIWSWTICKLNTFLQGTSLGISIFTLTSISLERYVMVGRFKRTRQSRRWNSSTHFGIYTQTVLDSNIDADKSVAHDQEGWEVSTRCGTIETGVHAREDGNSRRCRRLPQLIGGLSTQYYDRLTVCCDHKRTTIYAWLAAIWLASFAFFSPLVGAYQIVRFEYAVATGASEERAVHATYCIETWGGQIFYRQVYTICVFVLLYALPLIFMSCVYFLLARRIMRFPASLKPASLDDTRYGRTKVYPTVRRWPIQSLPSLSRVIRRQATKTTIEKEADSSVVEAGVETEVDSVAAEMRQGSSRKFDSQVPGCRMVVWKTKAIGLLNRDVSLAGLDFSRLSLKRLAPITEQNPTPPITSATNGYSSVHNSMSGMTCQLTSPVAGFRVAMLLPGSKSAGQTRPCSVRLRHMRHRQRQRVSRLLVVLVSLFAVCWAPYHGVQLFTDLYFTKQDRQPLVGAVVGYGHALSQLFAFANSAVNPYCTLLVSAKFRTALHNLLPTSWHCISARLH